MPVFKIIMKFKIFFYVLKVPHPERINKIGQLSYGPLREGSQVCPSLIDVCDPLPFPSNKANFIPFLLIFLLLFIKSICNNPWC